MPEATPVEALTTPAEGETHLSKAEKTPAEEAAHQLEKAEKKRKKREKRHKHRLSAWLGSTVFVMFHEVLASEIGASHSRIKVALASYSVALIMVAVAGGRIADIIGRKRMFVIGGMAFSAAALLGLKATVVSSLAAVPLSL